MPKRTFWLVTGAAIGAGSSLWAERKVRQAVHQAAARLQPDAIVVEVGRSARQAGGTARGRGPGGGAPRHGGPVRHVVLSAGRHPGAPVRHGTESVPRGTGSPNGLASGIKGTGKIAAGAGKISLSPGQLGFPVVTPGTAPDADDLRASFTRFFTERGHARS